jgi:hypothetical protein
VNHAPKVLNFLLIKKNAKDFFISPISIFKARKKWLKIQTMESLITKQINKNSEIRILLKIAIPASLMVLWMVARNA